MKIATLLRLSPAVCLMFFLAACGGGGGSGSSSSASAPSSNATYTLGGTVSGAVVSGVTVALGGSTSTTTTTTGLGDYSFAGLSNGRYTVTPLHAGYSFSPASSPVTVNSGNVTGVNFTVTAVYPRFAYVANYNANTVSQYTIGSTGSLTPMATPTVGAGASPFSVITTGAFQ